MTNSEKYLKDEMLLKDFISDYIDYCKRNKKDSVNLESLSLFFREEAKPILTEDERVILKNLKSIHNVIGRNRDGNIQLMCKEPRIKDCIWHINLSCYNHLFQFIKERRRIRDKGAIK